MGELVWSKSEYAQFVAAVLGVFIFLFLCVQIYRTYKMQELKDLRLPLVHYTAQGANEV